MGMVVYPYSAGEPEKFQVFSKIEYVVSALFCPYARPGTGLHGLTAAEIAVVHIVTKAL
jgi:hypothetical protein